ncbi:hypothetical protein [Parasitella parasitica]|uniref:Uncharacterized protein n=1 Tax=Parasitella parasitica TaxID=35722 RepID=A0A0B7N2F6_9FUNG|nr:hypothetical protein [Parasitella parasitica]
MDDTLSEYDESLKVLEKQKERLELVMKKMGAEWEESGAGIGWMADVLSNPQTLQNDTVANASSSGSVSSIGSKSKTLPLLHMIHTNAGPSQDYLQTLLNVNEELLAQSLASAIDGDTEELISSNSEYNIVITPPPPPASSSNDNISTFVAQQQLISPPLTKEDRHSLSQQQPSQKSVTSKSSPYQAQLATPPITPHEQQLD